MMVSTIGIIGAGAMGSAVGRRLVEHGARVLTPLEGRSPAAQARAAAAGMEAAAMAQLAAAELVLSIVPPAEAIGVAERFAAGAGAGAGTAIYVDCNALDVRTVETIARAITPTGLRFVDAGIIGLPPAPGAAGPTFYLSGDPAAAAAVLLAPLGLVTRTMDGPVGAASALKMSYAGITKGLAALGSMMILAADRAGAGPALHAELAASQPQLLARFGRSLPDMVPKAYRWVAEMREIAAFLDADPAGSATFKAIAEFYGRIADDAGADRKEVAVIEAFARDTSPR